MKNIIMIFALVGGMFLANAQEKVKGDYVKEGNLIKATLYHDNGEISQKGFYTKQGKLEGTWMSFDQEGNKTAEAHYANGQKTGKWFFWQDDNILKEVDYDNSKISAVSTWKIQGERVVSSN
ncbi:MAG: nicotinic acid mononucleotide adenyltransferase [Leeuwenhoekiella sp.]